MNTLEAFLWTVLGFASTLAAMITSWNMARKKAVNGIPAPMVN